MPYRPAMRAEATEPDDAPHQIDLSALDAATARHMSLQDELADELRERGIEPRSPGSWQPHFGLAFEREGQQYVVELKGGAPVSAQQVRLGVGQILEYRHLLSDGQQSPCRVLILEGEPPQPWDVLLDNLGITVIRADAISKPLDHLLLHPGRAADG